MTPMIPITIIDHVGYVVVDDESIKANILERADGLDDIDIAFAQEALLKGRHAALDISKMNVENLSALAEITDRFDDTWAHLAETAHAKIQTMIWAGRDLFHCFLKA